MSKRNSPGKKSRQAASGKSTVSRKDAAARRRDLAKRVNEAPQTNEEQSSDSGPPKSEDPPAQFQTAAVPVKKMPVKRAVPAKKTAVKKSSFEIINKSAEPKESQPSPPAKEETLSTQPPTREEVHESTKVSLKAPGARSAEDPVPDPAPAPEVIKPAVTEKSKSSIPLRKETMRVSLKAPGARDAGDPVPPPPKEPVPVSKSSVPLRKETMRVSLKAPGAGSAAAPPNEPVAPESPVAPEVAYLPETPATPREEAYQPKKEKAVPVRKETIRVSLKAPSAEEADPMENWDILEPRKLSDTPKEDPNQKYAPPGYQDPPAASLDQIIEPSPVLEPEPQAQPQPEETPMSLDQALPLRKETMRVSVKAPFAGMAAAQAAAAREPILATQPTAHEPEPAPAVVLEQTTASVQISSQTAPGQAAPAPQAQPLHSELNTPLTPQPIKPKKDLGSILMTWVCILLGIVAAVMIYLAFFADDLP